MMQTMPLITFQRWQMFFRERADRLESHEPVMREKSPAEIIQILERHRHGRHT